MTTPLINLRQLHTREQLVEAWEYCVLIARKFPDDPHWAEVIKGFKERATELGVSRL